MVASVFNIKGESIQILSNLSSAYETDFMEAVSQIISDGGNKVILDFSAIHYISSTTIGLIVAASAKAAESEIAVKVMASRSILNILTTCGISSMIDIEVV